MTGVEFLAQARDMQPDAVRILITAYADLDASIQAVNRGHIFYYVSKPWEPDELLLLVRRAYEQFRLIRENQKLTAELRIANEKLNMENIHLRCNLEERYNFSSIVGNSPAMLEVFKMVSRVIDAPTTVLLVGETGTGKEILAKAIHFNSRRKNALFVAQNCGALPEALLESELFGHVKGSFTGAVVNKKGIFELADGGTVFLDEIGDTSAAMQIRLLRVLQEGEFRPLGGTKTMHADCRVIAATHKNLEDEVKAGRFREDLFYRLCVFPVYLPPLRDRREDIPDLVRFFVQKYSKRMDKKISGVNDPVLELFRKAAFPGNIRELENEIERAVTLAESGDRITQDLLSPRFQNPGLEASRTTGVDLKKQVESLERDLIQKAMKETRGNILKAAEMLGISRAGFYKMLSRLGLNQ